jgi:Rod binding domain-containing protein
LQNERGEKMRAVILLLAGFLVVGIFATGCESTTQRMQRHLHEQRMAQIKAGQGQSGANEVMLEKWKHEERLAEIEAGARRMSKEEMEQLAEMVADRVADRVMQQIKELHK